MLATATVTAALTLPAMAQEKPVGSFGWFGVGKALEVEKGHFYWAGEFSGTFFSDKGAGGYCIVQDADDDQATLSWRNAGTPGPGGRGPGTFEWTSGTGKYKGISGSNTFVGVTQINWADGTTSGYATWNR